MIFFSSLLFMQTQLKVVRHIFSNVLTALCVVK